MPSNFTPEDREVVQEKMESKVWVHDTSVCGPGLILQEGHQNRENIDCLGSLMENAGWYLAAKVPGEGGDVSILMPVMEVDV